MAPIVRPAPEQPTVEETILIVRIHGVYERLTGLRLPLTTARKGHWCAWLRRVGSATAEADLSLVLRYLVRLVDKGTRNPGCLKLQNLVMKPEQWEEELAFAQRAARVRPRPAPTTREERFSVIEQDGTTAVVSRQVEHDAAALAQPEHIGADVAAKLREFRRQGMRQTPATPLAPVQTPSAPSAGA